jgi:ACT domain-containing protein
MMTNEELIYQITRAVYHRLGGGADKELVENLVTDLYRLVRNEGAAGAVNAESGVGRSSRIVISAFGVNRPGIVAAISATLAESQYSIVDMNQTVVQGKFAMVLIAEASAAASDLGALKARLKEAGERVGVRIYAQREDLFQAMHRV